MSTQPIRDYLTKQLLIERNIVTYRSLSRVLELNVNVAKNELADFHANDGQNLAATYLLSGQTLPVRKRVDEDVDMDENPYIDEDEEEYVPQTEILLVGERDLESAQAQFVTLDSIHVYSLSPSIIRDSGLLCTPTEIVRELDAKKGSELASIVGKVVGADVHLSNNKTLSSWGGRKAPLPVAGPSKTTTTTKKAEDPKPKEEKAKPEKPKATGKLDFSKAKTKPLKKEEEKPAKGKEKAPSRAPSVASTIGEKVQAKMDESKKRGTKRKSALESDSEEEVAKPAAESSVRVRKGVVLSDDEDEGQPTRKGKGKGKAPVSEAEKDLHAMMDIDDNEVTRASRDAEPDPEDEDEPMEIIDADADKPSTSKPAPAKRKSKKVVPVGKNGLKKKRVVKSRSRIDEKGYMVMEDYSEYESVDEEEPAPPPPKVKKTKSADAAPTKAKPAPKPAPAPAKAKPKPSVKSGQPTMASFFGKSKSK
ncbi:DNA polymerase subunit Cdc27 [Mycena sanguinolenta]|uniref:DNA polymerase delta subunit 3 n=1 Tax=Mycena sanguinolenta TaxID=230812 RepID=A0A8H7DG78_9AGAR|nr:DNA polymerase subunit Cdc27 [Mycena sanguinolenta]